VTDPGQPKTFVPPNLLKARVAPRIGALSPDALAKAEAALKALSNNFGQWLNDEIVKLETARARIAEQGMTRETAEQFFIHAHDLKGLGGTYEFPLITRIAGSLCKLMSDKETRASAPLPLVDAHIDAIKAVVRDDIRDPAHPVGSALAAELERRVAVLSAD
jgi:chemotaxis protein histidine kinase CheA